MLCSQCGEKISDNSKYCMHCGVKVGSTNSNQEIQSEGKDVESLKKQFREDMFKIYRDASAIGYRPSYCLRMISEQRDIVDIARQLIVKETSGFEKLALLKRTDLSVEHYVLMPKYGCLFNDNDKKRCKERLEA